MGQSVWNSLPDSVKAGEHQKLFKKERKMFVGGVRSHDLENEGNFCILLNIVEMNLSGC